MLKPAYKFWLETKEGYIFGKGAFELLQRIQETKTLSGGAKALGMSYRHAWGIIKEIEKRIGKPLLRTYKGGKIGGGGAELTQTGKNLIKTYLIYKNEFDQICRTAPSWKELDTRLSTRNETDCEVISVERGDLAAAVKLRTMKTVVITSLITEEEADGLKLKKGNKVKAIIEATSVKISKEEKADRRLIY